VGGAKSLAHASFLSSMSTATIVVAPASTAPAIAPLPTPPHPNTATDDPRRTFRVHRRADTRHHATAEEPSDGR